MNEEQESVDDRVRRIMNPHPDQREMGSSVGFAATQAMDLVKIQDQGPTGASSAIANSYSMAAMKADREKRLSSRSAERMVVRVRKRTCVDGKLMKFRVDLECGYVVTVIRTHLTNDPRDEKNPQMAVCEHCRSGR